MIDTHCHLYLEQFDNDRESVIEQAVQAGVQKMLVPGIDHETSKRTCLLSKKYSRTVYAAVGVHPNYSNDIKKLSIRDLIEEFSEQVVAIGEIGLDYFRDYTSKESQRTMLEKMLLLSREYKLPICLHCRNAEDNLLAILSKWYSQPSKKAAPKGVFHAFEGSQQVADWAKRYGFFIGIGGLITYKKNKNMKEIVKNFGIENIVIETDSPYLSPVPNRGKRNSPLNLPIIVDTLAHVFNKTADEISRITDQNAMLLFGLN